MRRRRTWDWYLEHPRALEEDAAAYEDRRLAEEERRVDRVEESRCPGCGDRRGLLRGEWTCWECSDGDASDE